MNKKLFGFVLGLLFIFSSFTFVNNVFAAAITLSVSSTAKTSVILKATGFVPDQTFSISVSNNQNLKTPSYSKNISVTADNNGEAEVTFSGLTPGGNYNAFTSITNKNSISFSTYLDLTSNKGILISKNVYADNVILELSGAIPNESYDINLYTDPTYDGENDLKQKVFKTNSNGLASDTFTLLLDGTHYIAQFKPLSSDVWSDPIYIFTPVKLNSSSLNFSALNGVIKIVSGRLDGQIVEGTNVGQYKVGSKALLQQALTDAEYYNGDASVFIQSDIDRATSVLENALNTFELSKIETNSTSTSTSTSSSTGSSGSFLSFEGGVVPKCNVGNDINTTTGQYNTPCDFSYFMLLINNVIKFLLFVIATPLMALIIIYMAWLMISSGGNSEQVTKVKHILFNAVVGYVIALAAWLIVNTIVKSLKVDPEINTFMEQIDKNY